MLHSARSASQSSTDASSASSGMMMTARSSATPALEFTVVRTPEDLAEALAVRRAVFVEEQDVPLAEEVDEYDVAPSKAHGVLQMLGRLDGRVVCTGRIDLTSLDDSDRPARITRVAVRREYRARGLGSQLMGVLHTEARAHGVLTTELNAQLQSLGFYERLGYCAHGPVFLDAGIEHQAMKFTL